MRRRLLSIAVLSFLTLTSTATTAASVKGALDNEFIGLQPADQFLLRTGKCADCAAPKQNLWYFENELIAVPAKASASDGLSKGRDRNSDVASWAATTEAKQLSAPSVVWISAPDILENASILPGAQRLRDASGQEFDFKLVPQIATNRSYANTATFDFFKDRTLRLRGTLASQNGRQSFTARTIWPTDFSLDVAALKHHPLRSAADITAFVRAPAKQQRTTETRLLWERHPGAARAWQDKPVLGIVLNGAQGDDDESLGGHFAVATGRLGAGGDWSTWAVNNFYNLDSVSEKGILAATVPMDNYLMDLNSGQQYYRPSTMLVAVLNNGRTAVAYQGGVQRVFNHFYRHDFRYRHAAANCTGISVDVFEALGWHIPKRGPTAPLKSLGAYAYVAGKEMSLAGGRKIYDYLNEEQTRLLPAVAFDAIGQDLLHLVGAGGGASTRALSAYEQQLQNDVEAILLMRIPQIPSSRAMGSAPVFSFDEFRARVPADQADWKIVPVGARPFPAALQEPDFQAEPDPAAVPLPVAALGGGVVLAALAWRRRRRAAANKANKAKAAPAAVTAQ